MYQDDENVHVYIDTVLFFFQSKGGGGGGDCATHSVPATGYLDCSV